MQRISSKIKYSVLKSKDVNNILKIKLISITLWLITILWLILIFTLSSQNGVQTAQTSGGIAKDVAEIIYQQPTEPQVNQVHFNIRKLAHVGLFFVLGVLSFSASATTFGWEKTKSKCVSISVALAILSVYGFFDEWHKQFIDGRHFQLNEAVLNMVSGTVGIVFIIAVFWVVNKIKLSHNQPI